MYMYYCISQCEDVMVLYEVDAMNVPIVIFSVV